LDNNTLVFHLFFYWLSSALIVKRLSSLFETSFFSTIYADFVKIFQSTFYRFYLPVYGLIKNILNIIKPFSKKADKTIKGFSDVRASFSLPIDKRWGTGENNGILGNL